MPSAWELCCVWKARTGAEPLNAPGAGRWVLAITSGLCQNILFLEVISMVKLLHALFYLVSSPRAGSGPAFGLNLLSVDFLGTAWLKANCICAATFSVFYPSSTDQTETFLLRVSKSLLLLCWLWCSTQLLVSPGLFLSYKVKLAEISTSHPLEHSDMLERSFNPW